MLPDYLLIHDVTAVEPAEVLDANNNTVYDYDAGTRTDIRVWLQQNGRGEPFTDGRDPLQETWLLMGNYDGLTGRSRIEWPAHPTGPVVFETHGPPEPAYSPAGFHHVEVTLRIFHG